LKGLYATIARQRNRFFVEGDARLKRIFSCPVNLLLACAVQVDKINPGRDYMNKLKTWLFGGALVASAAVTLPMVLHADSEGHGRFGRRLGAHQMFAGGAPIISLALKHQGELKLTPDQVANLEKTRTHYQNQIAPLHEQLKTLESDISKLAQETPADLIQLKAKIQDGEKLRSELRYLRMEALENGKSILSPQQRDQLKSLLASRGENRRQQKQAS
jgi:Spy/CpxP family protein refolding chaperone